MQTTPRNIADLLVELKDSGKGFLQEHCVSLMVQCVADGVAALREAREDTVAAANSRYADDPEAYVATLGTISEFEMGLDRYNGRPDGDNVHLQMQIEFADDTSFKTSNYGGVETTLSLEWEFVVNPQPDKVYPGEVGLPKPGGGSYPGRNRKSIDTLL